VKFLHTLMADLRERQILPAVVLLAILAVVIPVGASKVLSKVTVPQVHVPATVLPALPKGLLSPAKELDVVDATPQSQVVRGGAEPNPFREGSPSSSGSSTTAPSTTTSTKAPTHTTTTTPAHTTQSTHTTTTTTSATHTTTAPHHTTTTPPHHTTTTTSTHTTTPSHTTTHTQTHTTTAQTHTRTAQTHTTTTTTTTSTESVTTGTAHALPIIGPSVLKDTQAYTVTLDTSDAQGTHVLTKLERLTPLPAAQSPEIIFLGVLKGGDKAVFLFTDPVSVTGSASIGKACLPSASDCQIVEFGPGQGMKLVPSSNTALIATFTFSVASIGAADYANATTATAARDAVSSAGQALLSQSGSSELPAFHFDTSLGSLVFQTPAPGSSTGASGTTTASGATGATGASSQVGASGATGATGS
jgi:hypothetical protein